ncbi:Uncharacterised protein [Mycobacterium tuberculosis]|nr:Uncharacterised protein [Mycobacterium tuberculosis]
MLATIFAVVVLIVVRPKTPRGDGNRPKTPRGDGNFVDHHCHSLSPRVVRPKTPRGDGNYDDWVATASVDRHSG